MNARKNDDVSKGMSACEPALLFQFEQRCDEFLERGAALLASMNPKTFGYDELGRMVNRQILRSLTKVVFWFINFPIGARLRFGSQATGRRHRGYEVQSGYES
ncbi:MAG: hypothetical protein LBQ56_02060 [Synergistaceae bacterium]|jgi:hypothetical protein|nr:hypothetical protein [Synergistaceae bacterium]